MKKNILITLASVGLIFILGSLVVFVTQEVVGFDIFSSTENACVPYNVFVERGEGDNVVEVSWTTEEKCMGFVQYGKDSEDLNLIGVDLVNDSQSRNHTVTLKGVLSTEKYYFLINSDGQGYGLEGIPLEFVLSEL